MKKLLILVSFIFLSVNLNAQKADLIVGKWVFSKILNEKVDESARAYLEAEVIGKWKFEFYSDGKYTTFMEGEKANGEWKLNIDANFLMLTGIEGETQKLEILKSTKNELALKFGLGKFMLTKIE